MRKRYGATVLGVLLLMVLLAGAFTVPIIINHIYDSRTLGQVNQQEINLSTYEFTYQSFEEKLRTIGRAISEGTNTELIEISQNISEGQSVSNAELVQKAAREVDLLLNDIMGLNISIQEDGLYERRLFTIWGQSADNAENMLSGINVYKLSFGVITADKKEVVLSLYMDAEFYKIYAFALENTSADSGSFFIDLKARISEMLCEYWELEQDYMLTQREEYTGNEMVYWDSDNNWSGYGEDILVYEDGVSLYLLSELIVMKYGTSITAGVFPFTYMY